MSENIPPLYRPYFALHETCCIPHMGEHGHCVSATKKEISQLPENIRQEYIAYRISFLE